MSNIVSIGLIENCDPHGFMDEVTERVEGLQKRRLIVDVQYTKEKNNYSALIIGRKRDYK
ncbi:hypothetical protein [Zhenhengia yiwuensis]|uniref:Uncharacterized protein n=1 Tax=Zhenhengia yiwuensis TaxID=2763666 RepID=A0A926IDX4_9FIRM|nr:hypothetical protein [Zhenhengia yiwuensis]MBC8579158.1 hypothetical protein [Zhenhengia yiwuensis]